MNGEDILTILVVIGVVIFRIIGGVIKFKRQAPPADPSESMRKILESMKPGDSRPVIITRDDGKPVAPQTEPEASPAPPFDPQADAALLKEQQHYAALAAQAEARLAAATPNAYAVNEDPEHQPEHPEPLHDFIRHNAQNAITLSIILAPPPGLTK